MKNLKILFFSFSFLTMAISFSACGDEGDKKQGKEYTSAYICPMHCKDSGSDAAGKCPTCKMDYVVNEDFKGQVKAAPAKEDHSGHDHSGHDHSGHDHSGHNH